jgi:putative redox protein
MKVVARRKVSGANRMGGYVHDVEIEGGRHRLVVDEPLEAGGTDIGPAPTRLLAAGLASCIAITIEMYAQRKEWDVGAVEVDVDVTYEDFTPSSFAATIRLPPGLSDAQRQQLLVIARKCPVHKVLTAETPVSVSDRLEDQADA